MPQPSTTQIAVTFGAATSISSIADLSGVNICGIIFPSTWTTAPVTFLAAPELSTGNLNQSVTPATGSFVKVVDTTGVEVSYGAATALASTAMTFSPLNLQGFRYLELASGPSGARVSQTTAETVWLLTTAEAN